MRKGAILAVLALLFGLFGASPALATHQDTEDGDDCRETALVDPEDEEGLGVTSGEESEEDGRSAACVSAEGFVVFYIGGTTEDKEGGPCGAIIVADQTVTGSSDWGSDEPEDKGLVEEAQGGDTTAQGNAHCEEE